MNEMIGSHYAATLSDAPGFPVLEEATSADVCVIGGGLAGLAAALGLAERGKSVVLLEGRRIGWGASGRNGGFVLAGFAAGIDSITEKVGLAHAQALFALTRKAQTLIRRRIAAFGIPCHPVDGHLRVSWFADTEKELRGGVEKMRERFGVPAEFWPQEKVRDACRTSRYHAGQFFPDYFHMDPLAYLHGIAKAAAGKGVRIFESTMAEGMLGQEGGFTVKTVRGSVRADHVILCGSAYDSSGLHGPLRRSCLPVSTYVMVTEPVAPEKMRTAINAPYAIRDDRWADDYYRILPDNSLLWGGRVGLGRGVPANLPDLMRNDLLRVYPQLEGIKVHRAWSGVMGYTVHKMPLVRRLRPGLWCCTCFGGNGVGPTTAGGEAVAAAICGAEDDLNLFDPFGFGFAGGPLGPFVARSVYYGWEIRDRMREIAAGSGVTGSWTG